jgi:hypothetical protein
MGVKVCGSGSFLLYFPVSMSKSGETYDKISM